MPLNFFNLEFKTTKKIIRPYNFGLKKKVNIEKFKSKSLEKPAKNTRYFSINFKFVIFLFKSAQTTILVLFFSITVSRKKISSETIGFLKMFRLCSDGTILNVILHNQKR